ncbi:DUF3817 domain-containing protein [Pollutibacter soli]|uniref:DUF3817 domain-containing protein n=1 Tax=Pollutibacter soli TaxID=3034157 RepID=UPI0030139AAA
MKTALSRLRIIGNLEGVSYLLLLGIAMPLKYFGGYPEAVKYTGWLHGLLFVAFIFALADVMISRKWSLKKTAIAFISSLLPFGTFLLDKPLKAEEKAAQATG